MTGNSDNIFIKFSVDSSNFVYIFYIHGRVVIDTLNDIEKQIREDESPFDSGEYEANVSFSPEERSKYGRVENEGYFEIDVLKFTSDEELECKQKK